MTSIAHGADGSSRRYPDQGSAPSGNGSGAPTQRPQGAEPTMKPIRVLVADDEPQVREILAAVIGTDARLQLVGQAEEAEAAIGIAAAERPDVALVDVRMPGGGGARATRGIVERSAETKV